VFNYLSNISSSARSFVTSASYFATTCGSAPSKPFAAASFPSAPVSLACVFVFSLFRPSTFLEALSTTALFFEPCFYSSSKLFCFLATSAIYAP
jgi:hypothetical protein